MTPDVIEDVCRLLPTALYLETVANFLGIHRTTFRRWLNRGAKEAHRLRKSGTKPKPGEAIHYYPNFPTRSRQGRRLRQGER